MRTTNSKPWARSVGRAEGLGWKDGNSRIVHVYWPTYLCRHLSSALFFALFSMACISTYFRVVLDLYSEYDLMDDYITVIVNVYPPRFLDKVAMNHPY